MAYCDRRALYDCTCGRVANDRLLTATGDLSIFLALLEDRCARASWRRHCRELDMMAR